jgi:hypothetical protein
MPEGIVNLIVEKFIMVHKIEEEVVTNELSAICVNLNMINGGMFQITCSRVVIGGYSTALTYVSEIQVREVLRSFGFGAELINDRLANLRRVNAEEIRPFELVRVGELQIPKAVLRGHGFTAA